MADDQIKVDILTETKSSITSIAKYTAAIGGAYLAVSKIISASKDLVKAYSAQEQAEAKLASAIKATGGNVNSQLSYYKAFASEMQNVTVIGDEVTLSLIGQAKFLGITEDKMKESVQGAIGLSEALGMDLNAAIKAVANAQNGNYEQLARYVPALRNATDETEKAAIMQKLLGDTFDAAKAKALTGTGAIQQLNNTIGDAKEQFGRAILESITPFIQKLNEIILNSNNARESIYNLNKVMSQGIGKSSVEDLTSALTAAQNELKEIEKQYNTVRQGERQATKEMVVAAQNRVSNIQIEIMNKKYLQEATANYEKEQKASDVRQKEASDQKVADALLAYENKIALDALYIESQEAYYAQMAEIDNRYVEFKKKEADTEAAIQDQKLAASQQFFSGWAELAALGADKSFALAVAFKALASAEAAINSYLAFTKALASAPWPFNIAAASGVLAAGLAQQIKINATPMPKYAQGGDFITSGPQAIMVGDNATGRERVKVEPLGADGDGSRTLVIPITLNGRELGRAITVMSKDGKIITSQRSVR